MKKLLIIFVLLAVILTNSNAQVPCNLNGSSVYIDHTFTPSMMNASVNGMSMYSYTWTNGTAANQTPYYINWCVTITDLINGCDTTICENCIADTTALCPCPFIYAPVCGCDGVQYANYCLADCAGVGWSPAVSNGMPGGFLPCSQPCEVEISGDSIVCSWSSPHILTASSSASSSSFLSYQWYYSDSSSTGLTLIVGAISPVLTIVMPGTYCVTAIDVNGCSATECINVAVQEIPIYSVPSPPIICPGDSIVLEIDTVGLSNITWIPNTLLTPPVHRVVDFPVFSHPYIVEAIDSLGCDRRGEIFVNLDSCVLCIDSSLINPQIMCPMVVNPVCGCDGNTYMNDCEALNWYGVTSWNPGPCNPTSNFACMGGVVPGINTCVGPGNYAIGQPNVVSVYSTMAACLADSCNIITPPPCAVDINNGSADITICDGDSALLEATIGFDTYVWTEASIAFPVGNTANINVSAPGFYTVTATDLTNNCIDVDSIQVIYYLYYPLNPVTVPNPPIICLGDSLVIEVNSLFLNYWWNTGNPLDQDQDRVVVYPTQDFTYVVEALDVNGCESREEIEVFVDTCASFISQIHQDSIQIYPNPAADQFFINLDRSNFYNVEIIDILGRSLIRKEHVNNLTAINTTKLSEGTYFVHIQTYIDSQIYKIVIDR